MKTFSAVLLILAVLAIAETRWHGHHKDSQINHDKNDWDVFLLVTQWPFSACEKENATGYHECVIPKYVDSWILHGLWPSCSNGGYNPQYCSHQKFDYNKIKDLKDRMMKYWPNLFVNSDKYDFWKHEFEKHGTCAENVEGFETENGFFKVALDLRDKYDTGRILSDHGISPRDAPYKGADVKHALNKGLNAKGCAACKRVKGIDGYVLMSTSVCLNKSLQLVNCPYCRGECYDDEIVYYQPIH